MDISLTVSMNYLTPLSKHKLEFRSMLLSFPVYFPSQVRFFGLMHFFVIGNETFRIAFVHPPSHSWSIRNCNPLRQWKKMSCFTLFQTMYFYLILNEILMSWCIFGFTFFWEYPKINDGNKFGEKRREILRSKSMEIIIKITSFWNTEKIKEYNFFFFCQK